MAQRESISPGARKLAEEGLSSETKKTDPLTRKNLTYKEALKIFMDHSKEAFQITAVVSDYMIKRALEDGEKFPPFGLMKNGAENWSNYEPVTELKNLNDLRNAMKKTLGIEQYLIYLDLKKKQKLNKDDRMAAIYARYEKLYLFAQEYIKGVMDSILDLEAGINTASNTMAWTLENILEVFERQFPGQDLTIDEFTQIAKNSWPFIAKVASLHRHDLSAHDFDPKSISLEHGAQGYRLQYTQEAKEEFEVKATQNDVADRDKRPTYGCPAMVNFGDGSGIRKLWDFHIDIVQKMYQRNYSGDSVFKLLNR